MTLCCFLQVLKETWVQWGPQDLQEDQGAQEGLVLLGLKVFTQTIINLKLHQ